MVIEQIPIMQARDLQGYYRGLMMLWTLCLQQGE